MIKKKKNPRLFVILHSERWPRKHRFGEAGEQTGTKSPPLPLPILSLYANPKDVSSRDLFHRINPSQTLEIRATRFDSIPFIFPYVSVRVCSRERGRDSRLISRIENEKKGKEEGDLGKKKKIWIFAVYFWKKIDRHGIW